MESNENEIFRVHYFSRIRGVWGFHRSSTRPLPGADCRLFRSGGAGSHLRGSPPTSTRFAFENKIKFKFECQIMQMYANFEWIWCVTSPPMMLGGTRTMRRGSVALTTQVLTPGIPGTPGMPDRPGLPLGPVKPVVQAICLIKSNSLT